MTEQDSSPLPSTSDTVTYATGSEEPYTGSSLKRPASPSFEGLEEDSRKRMKDNHLQQSDEPTPNLPITLSLVDELAQELQCGCCSELVYKPVIVAPCQHFFCGR
jgi:E3 ubiquitin-protein ligase CHFR